MTGAVVAPAVCEARAEIAPAAEIARRLGLSAPHVGKAGAPLGEELKARQHQLGGGGMHGGAPPDLAELCEASGDRLLAHAISGEGCAAYQRNGVRLHGLSSYGEENREEIEALEEMLETLELAALYHWLGRNGEEAQRQRAAPAATTACIAAAPKAASNGPLPQLGSGGFGYGFGVSQVTIEGVTTLVGR